MKRYILTGTPGSGTTSIARRLEIGGYSIVEEAASDIIALQQANGLSEPWTVPSFIDDITNLQKQRQLQTSNPASELQFYDRSPICTHALSAYLGFPISITLSNERERIEKGSTS